MKTLVVAVLLVSSPAVASQWDVIAYECEQLATNKEPAKCSVKNSDVGYQLTVTVLASPNDSAEKKKRASYLVDNTIYRFTSLGGRLITEQSRLKDGRKIERSCSPLKGQKTRVSCHDWKLAEWN